MKKLLAILAGISLTSVAAAPVEAAYTTSAKSKSDVHIKDVEANPTEMETKITNGEQMHVSFKQNILLLNNKPVPEVTQPDYDALDKAKYKDAAADIYGFGVRIYCDVYYWGSETTNPAHDWTPRWVDGIGNPFGEPDDTYGKMLANLNLRNIKIVTADETEANKINHKGIGDQDAVNVVVKVNVSFDIDLPELPFEVKVNVCDWHIQEYKAPGLKGGFKGFQEWDTSGGRQFKMWLPSKTVDKTQDAKNSKVPGVVKVG